jgi:DNA-binding IclR family transcriptional regulator
MLGTVTKAGRVLDLFTVANPEWGVREVAQRLQIPTSSAHGLLATLSEIGLMRKSPTGRYRLGWRIVELNRTLVDTTAFLSEAQPILRQLADCLSATAELGALRRHNVAILDRVVGGPTGPQAAASADATTAAHTSAIGQALLAHSKPEVLDSLIWRLSSRPGNACAAAAADLRAGLDAVRLRGVAFDIERTEPDRCSVAAPIRDTDGGVHTALGLTVPALSFRRNREVLTRSVERAATHISRNARSAGRSTVSAR